MQQTVHDVDGIAQKVKGQTTWKQMGDGIAKALWDNVQVQGGLARMGEKVLGKR
jgi:hypothetical protein